jgi:hypothetical protein
LHAKFSSWATLHRYLDGPQEPFERDPSWTKNQVGEYQGPVCHSFVTKYRTSKIFSSTPNSCSPFWHSIHKVKEHFRLGVRFLPGKDSSISFWKDVWIGEVPLCSRFPTLFAKSSDADLTMVQVYSEEGWRIFFRRALDQGDLQAWSELCSLVADIELDDVPTTISWRLAHSGKFSTKSLYLTLCKAPEVPLTKLIWRYQLPLKIKIFTWQLLNGACRPMITFMPGGVPRTTSVLCVGGLRMLIISSFNVT